MNKLYHFRFRCGLRILRTLRYTRVHGDGVLHGMAGRDRSVVRLLDRLVPFPSSRSLRDEHDSTRWGNGEQSGSGPTTRSGRARGRAGGQAETGRRGVALNTHPLHDGNGLLGVNDLIHGALEGCARVHRHLSPRPLLRKLHSTARSPP